MLDKETIEKMLKVANEAEDNAFIFKSNHSFGAAVLTDDGEIYGGCNVDGVISGMGTCAESSALNHAVVHGKYNIKAILVVDEKEFIFPCGTCLQYLVQFYQTTNKEIEVISAKQSGEYQSKLLHELLPEAYHSVSFDQKLKSFINR